MSFVISAYYLALITIEPCIVPQISDTRVLNYLQTISQIIPSDQIKPSLPMPYIFHFSINEWHVLL